jgi:multidrug resistance efflux pump
LIAEIDSTQLQAKKAQVEAQVEMAQRSHRAAEERLPMLMSNRRPECFRQLRLS